MRVLTIVGARPQFVKAAVVSLAMKDEGLEELLVHTGQHYDPELSAIFFDQLGIPEPAHSLDVGSGPHGQQTGLMLARVEETLLLERPRCVLVYGDTNSTLAGALAAAKLNIPVAHVEAGLRSFNRRMPEEINRIVTDHVSDLLFAPTDIAVKNLRSEGVAVGAIRQVGDVMLDTVRLMEGLLEPEPQVLRELSLSDRDYALLTLHRAENTDDDRRLRTLVAQLTGLAKKLPIVFPVHPRTRQALEAQNLWDVCSSVLSCVKAVGYLDMMALERGARIILTDSGGVQKEAFFWGKPCITLREETEWVELVDLGWNRLYGVGDPEPLCEVVETFLDGERQQATPYGDGRAAKAITKELAQWLGPGA